MRRFSVLAASLLVTGFQAEAQSDLNWDANTFEDWRVANQAAAQQSGYILAGSNMTPENFDEFHATGVSFFIAPTAANSVDRIIAGFLTVAEEPVDQVVAHWEYVRPHSTGNAGETYRSRFQVYEIHCERRLIGNGRIQLFSGNWASGDQVRDRPQRSIDLDRVEPNSIPAALFDAYCNAQAK